MTKYEELFVDETYLNSRQIRVLVYNLSKSSCVIPNIFDHILKYLHKNRQYVFGDTIEKFLVCFYNLGYDPTARRANQIESGESQSPLEEINFEDFAEIIHRDFNFMSGSAIVESCLALCFYRALPASLVNRLFNIEFITRLEDEIKLCYNKVFPHYFLVYFWVQI